jgi:hypothetical protein
MFTLMVLDILKLPVPAQDPKKHKDVAGKAGHAGKGGQAGHGHAGLGSMCLVYS